MLSKAHLVALYPRAPQAYLDAFAATADAVFARFQISATTNRLYFFLAQIAHESDALTLIEENLNYSAQAIVNAWPKRFPSEADAAPFARNPEKLANSVYANRMGNGPPESGDGYQFRGRGYIQITGRETYQAIGAIAGLDLEGSPDLAEDPAHALLVSCAFWQWKNLNAICDTGDFTAVTRRINGGTNGLADRVAWLDKVRRTFANPPTADDHPPPTDVIAIQQALRAQGMTEIGAADGLIGPRTISAITRFRQKAGLPPGLIDNQLRAALGLPAASA